MRWIKHDTDANQDAKLQNVLLDYGLEGYGLYWYCIELIAGKVDKDNITFELEHDARIIARNVGCTAQKVEEMMRYFVELGLFESSQGTVTCLKLARRLDKSMTSNPEMRQLIENIKSHDSIMTQSEKPMQDKIRLDKNRVDNKAKCGKQVLPPCPHQEVIKIWSEVMPEQRHPRVWDGQRAANLANRWKECFKIMKSDNSGPLYTDRDTGLEFWRNFFIYMRSSDFLINDCKPFGLDWIVNKANFTKIFEGNYHG